MLSRQLLLIRLSAVVFLSHAGDEMRRCTLNRSWADMGLWTSTNISGLRNILSFQLSAQRTRKYLGFMFSNKGRSICPACATIIFLNSGLGILTNGCHSATNGTESDMIIFTPVVFFCFFLFISLTSVRFMFDYHHSPKPPNQTQNKNQAVLFSLPGTLVEWCSGSVVNAAPSFASSLSFAWSCSLLRNARWQGILLYYWVLFFCEVNNNKNAKEYLCLGLLR